MTDPRDDIDTWLHAEVDPLQPPPGTFERIRKQARRRKVRRALVSAVSAGAAAAVIVLAVVALPRVVPSVLHLKSNPASDTAAAGPVASSPVPATSPAATSAGPTPDGTASRRVSGGLPPVPANFAATSVTFVDTQTGWVIGQAGTPGHCYSGNICTSMARTDNAGRSWYGLHAPRTGPPDGGTGVSQIRFLEGLNGWAFGPALWATHDGGFSWTQVPLGGLRVLSLETVGREAFAVVARCTGSGADFAAGCTTLWLYSSPADQDDWRQVPGTTGVAAAAGSAAIVLTGTHGYWYTPAGTLLSGPVTHGSSWRAVGRSALPCAPGASQPDGRPSAGQLAASGPGELALACPGSTQPGNLRQEIIYVSSDGGQSWKQRGAVTVEGTATSLAADGSVMALGTTHCIDVSADGGATWRTAQNGPAGGFSYVGLTSSTQGVAVPAQAGHHAVWFSYDGGQAWKRSPIRAGG